MMVSMSITPLRFVPLSPHIGVNVHGLDLRSPIPAEQADRLRAAFREHYLLLVRQPDLRDADQLRFTRLFGDVLARNNYDGFDRQGEIPLRNTAIQDSRAGRLRIELMRVSEGL